MDGASVVTDVSKSPSFEDAAALEFFETSTRNQLTAEAAARVGHHVVLSVVGTERLWARHKQSGPSPCHRRSAFRGRFLRPVAEQNHQGVLQLVLLSPRTGQPA